MIYCCFIGYCGVDYEQTGLFKDNQFKCSGFVGSGAASLSRTVQILPSHKLFSNKGLHGPDRQAIEQQTGSIWNEIVEPRPKDLKTTASIINNNTERKIATFVNINNHYEGSATLTINRLLEHI